MANRKCLDSMYDELYIVHDLHHFVDPPTLLFLLISLKRDTLRDRLTDSVTLPDQERLPPLKWESIDSKHQKLKEN